MPTLEQAQVAMSLKNGRSPDPIAQGKVFLSMWLLLRTRSSVTPAKLARQFGFTKAYVTHWIASGCPLDGAE